MQWGSVAFLALACGCAPAATAPRAESPRSAPSAPTTTAEELTAPAGHVELGDLALLQGGQERLVLAKNGVVHALPEDKDLGTLKRDGRFLDPTGKMLAQLTEQGEVVTGGGEFLPVTIDDSGAVRLLKENRVIELAPDGTLRGANPEGPVVTMRGVTPRTRRAAMFLLVLSAYPVKPQP